MAAESIILNAEIREHTGKAAARRFRRLEDRVPAIVYGANKKPEPISVLQKDILKALTNEAVYASILTLNINNKKQKVVLKDLQRHHSKPKIIHIDFMRIKANEQIVMSVPVHISGEKMCPGLIAGGMLNHTLTEIEIKCLPVNLPESITVDIATLELDHTIHLADLKLPEGVELATDITDDSNLAVASISTLKVESAEVQNSESNSENNTDKASKE